jgi:hypothetical protein
MRPTRATHPRWMPTNLGRVAALSLVLGATLSPSTAGAAQGTLNAPAFSPGARATVPMTIAVSGVADPSGTLRVYVLPGGGICAVTDNAPSVPPGATQVIAESPVGPFSYSATYTPPAEGSYSLCAYLFGPTTQTGTSVTSGNFSVGPAPPPPPAGAKPSTGPGATGTATSKTRCVVPTLKGRTYYGARLLIRRAGCSVGSVFRPDLRTSRRERARGRVLRVSTQYPRPRSIRAKGARVTLRLAYVTPKRSSASR